MTTRVLFLLALFFATLSPQISYARGTIISCLISKVRLLTNLHFNQFNTERSLEEYSTILGAAFTRALSSLGPNGHWVDAGAGRAQAIIDYRNAGKNRARVTGIAYKVPRNAKSTLAKIEAESEGNFRYLSDRSIEKIPSAEIGTADIITDVQGPLAYSTQIDQVLNKYMEVLKKNGKVFTDVLNDENVIITSNGPVNLQDWIERFNGNEIRVTKSDSGVLTIEKLTDHPFRFPKLELTQLRAGSPPDRTWRLAPIQ